jgi:hypothetical protein
MKKLSITFVLFIGVSLWHCKVRLPESSALALNQTNFQCSRLLNDYPTETRKKYLGIELSMAELYELKPKGHLNVWSDGHTPEEIKIFEVTFSSRRITLRAGQVDDWTSVVFNKTVLSRTSGSFSATVETRSSGLVFTSPDWKCLIE